MLQMYKNLRLILGSPLEVVTQCVNYWQNHQKMMILPKLKALCGKLLVGENICGVCIGYRCPGSRSSIFSTTKPTFLRGFGRAIPHLE